MQYSLSEQNGIQILTVTNLLNPTENQTIIDEVVSYLEQGKTEFVVDLGNMSYVNSTGLNFLISMLTRTRSFGGDLVLARVSHKIEQVLILVRLQTMFTIKESVEDAVAFLQTTPKART